MPKQVLELDALEGLCFEQLYEEELPRWIGKLKNLKELEIKKPSARCRQRLRTLVAGWNRKFEPLGGISSILRTMRIDSQLDW